MLLRAVLDDPAADLPRLAFADRLEEWSEPERAEFIRVQCELARLNDWHDHTGCGGFCSCDQCERWNTLKSQEWLLFNPAVVGWEFNGSQGGLQPWSYRLNTPPHPPWQFPDKVIAVFRRGWVDEIHMTLDALVGEDHKRIDRSVRKGGIAGALFAAHPVTKIVLTDREPQLMIGGVWAWHGVLCGERPTTGHNRGAYLPNSMIKFLCGYDYGQVKEGYSAYYQSRGTALNALPNAALSLCRNLAGLPPLE